MRIGIYCRELRASGGRAVGVGLLETLARNPLGQEITAYVPKDAGFLRLAGGAIRIVPRVTRGGANHLLAHVNLRRQLAIDRQDVVFMMGNLGLTHAPCPQVVLIHNPWVLYPESPAWFRCGVREWIYFRMRNLFITRHLQGCGAVATQTPVMVERIHRYLGIPYNRLALIPNGGSVAAPDSDLEGNCARRMLEFVHGSRALCLARFMPHKNIEVLLSVADELLALGRTDIGIYVTVDPTLGPGARRLLREMDRKGRGRVMHNLGEVPMAEVGACYQAADALLLPTLLESFSGTYVDAMRAGVPIITSDLDFARVVCGDNAFYIDPEEPRSIVAALENLGSKKTCWYERCTDGRKRIARFFHGWDAIAPRVISLLETVAHGEDTSSLLDDEWAKDWAACSVSRDSIPSGSDRRSCEI